VEGDLLHGLFAEEYLSTLTASLKLAQLGAAGSHLIKKRTLTSTIPQKGLLCAFRKRAMARTAHQHRQLDRDDSLAEIGLAAASIIHEVKNSLQGIGNALFLLEHDQSQGPKARKWIATARLELSRAIDASRQTLALVRQEAPLPVSISKLLDEVLDTYSGKVEYKGVTIDRRYKFNGDIEANAGAVREVFANIVLNALEAVSCRTGRLAIHTSAWSRVNGKEIAGVRIVFADNGPGIPHKHRKKIFEPLFSSKNGKGTGLGLWVCEKLVQQHRGELRLLAKFQGVSTGCCFSVFLPLKQSS
jgi:signal transduction histidine kinase